MAELSTVKRPLWRPIGGVRTERAARTLLCLPYAGKGPSLFHQWGRRLEGVADVRALSLAGREERIAEEPVTDPSVLIGELATGAAAYLDRPLYLFGHSMGALLAVELAYALRARTGIEPAALVLSGASPWWDPAESIGHLDGLPDDELLARLDAWGGIPKELFQYPDLLSMAIPVLRTDSAMVDALRSRPAPDAPGLSCPLLLLSGSDDERATAAQMAGWSRVTTGACRAREFAGDHFFLNSDLAGVLDAVRGELLGSAAAGGRG